ncbi:polysaccharide deacetylase family sporulation protein PdaB [Candidatus Clostridium stratigraminis]|uniref:Polysaccharide deacetylase family sporulation protein PdaB n=1 Tax=Candidatus Clostridium stratigraminis TaxID=3381661 RepID=A0ABW8T5Z4_9CLOT
MKSPNLNNKIYKRASLLLLLIFISSMISIGINYKSIGVFKFLYRELPIYNVDTKDKKVALTFDVSWGDDNTPKLLDILDKYNIKATFFLVGAWIDDNEALVKDMVKRGHELGNHTNKHPDINKISKEKLIEEIMTCDAKILSVTGEGTKLFRFPEGTYNDNAIKTVKATGHIPIQWDVDSIDWRENGAGIEYNRVIKKTKPGSILLFHNNAKYTPENLPKIIEKLKSEGYKFVKVSDLIYKDNYYLDTSGKQILK